MVSEEKEVMYLNQKSRTVLYNILLSITRTLTYELVKTSQMIETTKAKVFFLKRAILLQSYIEYPAVSQDRGKRSKILIMYAAVLATNQEYNR